MSGIYKSKQLSPTAILGTLTDRFGKLCARKLLSRSVMKTGLICLVLGATAATANAQTRRQPDTTALSCQQTQNLVRKFGAINLKSGPVKFDRYVVSRNKCFAGQTIRTKYVPTKDIAKCPLQVCAETSRNNN